MALFIRSKKSGARTSFWQNHLEEYKKSGLSQREYCKKNVLCLSSFTKWKRKLVEPNEVKFSFVEIAPKIDKEKSSPSIEVIISEKLTLRINEDINPGKLALLVNALKGAA